MAKLTPFPGFGKIRKAWASKKGSLKTAFALYAAGGLLAGAALSLLSTGVLGLAAERTLSEESFALAGTYIYDESRSSLVPAESLPWYAASSVSQGDSDTARAKTPIVLYVENPQGQHQHAIDLSDPPKELQGRLIVDAGSLPNAVESQGSSLDLSEIPSYDRTASRKRPGNESAANLASTLPENADGEKPLVSNVGYYVSHPEDPTAYRTIACLAIATVPLNFAVCLIVAGRLFYRFRLRRPLEQMDLAAKRISSGDLSFEMGIPRNDELGRLCEQFDAMRTELEKAERRLWESAESRRKVNAAFAHDLRTPLTVIEGQAELVSLMAACGQIDVEKARTASEAILRQAKRLGGYADSMTELESLESFKPRFVPIDLEEWFLGTAADVRSLADGKGVEFDSDRSEFPEMAIADPSAISQIAENLAANAVRHARTKVLLACVWNDGILEITVEDDGAGFTEDALAKACDPFWRGANQGDEDRGEPHFGLGLCICSVLCDRLEGSFRLGRSKLGGAKVTANVKVPCVPSERRPARKAASSTSARQQREDSHDS